MPSSQTTSFTEKKKETIIDGRLFVQSVVMERIQNENDDVAAMEFVVSHIEKTGLFKLGRQHSELYDESVVEEFYQEASVRVCSAKKGGDVAEISASISGVEIRINRHLLEDLFSLPSSGLKMEELESFGSEDLLSSFWCIFIGDSVDKKVHPSCHKRRFVLPFVYLHDFCCRIVENCTGDVPFAMNSKKIGPGKFIGGSKPTAFKKDILPADKPSVLELPQSENLRDVTKKSKAVSSKKRKHSLSDKVSQPAAPDKKKKKLRKAHKPKPTEVTTTPVEAPIEENAKVAQPTALNLQGATPREEVVTAISADPEPLAATMDNQLLANIEGTGESPVFPESGVTTPLRVSTPIQDPSPHREPSPVRDPSPLREPTPIRIPSSMEQAFERFVQWKSYLVAVYNVVYHWEDWEEEEKFILEIRDTTDISLLIRWEKSFCHERITNFYIAQTEASSKARPSPLIMFQVVHL
ncbi:hypothetical protein OROMI_009634 [Orobanche minor]